MLKNAKETSFKEPSPHLIQWNTHIDLKETIKIFRMMVKYLMGPQMNFKMTKSMNGNYLLLLNIL